MPPPPYPRSPLSYWNRSEAQDAFDTWTIAEGRESGVRRTAFTQCGPQYEFMVWLSSSKPSSWKSGSLFFSVMSCQHVEVLGAQNQANGYCSREKRK